MSSDRSSGYGPSAIILLVGLWLIVSPWVLGQEPNTRWTWSSVVSGVIVCALGIVDATTRPRAMAEVRRRGLPGRDVPGVVFAWEDHPLWAPAGEFRGIGPRNWRRPDEQILADVCERMTEHPRLDASEVDVIVANGEVTLEGVVASRAARRLAEAIADTVTGVRDVSNQLRIRDEDGEVRRAA